MALYLTVLLFFLNSMGAKGSRIVLSLDALQQHAGAFEVGLLAATFGALPLLLSMRAGRVTDRFGVRAPMIIASLVNAAGMLVPLLGSGLWVLYVSGSIVGVANIFFHVANSNLVGALGKPEERAGNFGTFLLGGSASGVAGPMAGGWMVDHAGFAMAYVLMALTVFVPLFIVAGMGRLIPDSVTAKKEEAPANLRDYVTNVPLRNSLVINALIISGLDLFSFYMPIYGKSIGMQATVIGVIVGMQAVAGFMVRLALGRMVERVGVDRLVIGSLAISALAYLLFPFFQDAMLLAAIALVLGLGLGCGQPLTLMLTYNHSPPGRAGAALGVRMAVTKFTQLVVPLLFGSVGSALGVLPVFLSNAALLAGGGWLIARELKRPTVEPQEERDGA